VKKPLKERNNIDNGHFFHWGSFKKAPNLCVSSLKLYLIQAQIIVVAAVARREHGHGLDVRVAAQVEDGRVILNGDFAVGLATLIGQAVGRKCLRCVVDNSFVNFADIFSYTRMPNVDVQQWKGSRTFAWQNTFLGGNTEQALIKRYLSNLHELVTASRSCHKSGKKPIVHMPRNKKEAVSSAHLRRLLPLLPRESSVDWV